MITQYTITDAAWTPITSAGQSCICWLDDDNEDAGDSADVRVWHDTTPSDSAIDIARRVIRAKNNSDAISLVAAREDDIYYARCARPSSTAKLCVDTNGVGIQKISGDVSVQDQHTEIVDVYLCREISTTALASEAVANTRSVTLATGHGAVVGNVLCIKNGTWYQGRILTVVGDVITVNQPFNRTYPTGSTARITSSDMNVNGSVTPVVFSIYPPATLKWDITRIIGVIRDDAAMDDGKFGGLAQLAVGVMFRVKIDDTHYNNLFNARNNGEFAVRTYDVSYIDATLGPSGQYGLRFRRSFNGFDKNGVVVRLYPGGDNRLEVVVQDDLTGLAYFSVVAQGHVVED